MRPRRLRFPPGWLLQRPRRAEGLARWREDADRAAEDNAASNRAAGLRIHNTFVIALLLPR